MATLRHSNYLSHPGRYLEDHLTSTCRLALQASTGLFDQDFRRAVEISSLLHDIGKISPYFQKYIRGEKVGEEKHHSPLSALIVSYVVRNEEPLFQILATVPVLRHHGDLKTLYDVYDVRTFEKAKDVLSRVDSEELKALVKILVQRGFKVAKEVDVQSILAWAENLDFVFDIRKFIRKATFTPTDILKIQTAYSLVTDADILDLFPVDLPTVNFSVETYLENLEQTSEIGKIRREAYRSVLSQEFDPRKRIYSITLPTGIGKTLISLAFAKKILDAGNQERIIYCLPFLSIIDQNYLVYEKVLGDPSDERILLKHHHLSDLKYGEFEESVSKLLIEGWNSRIIVTTFLQFFYMVFGHKKSFLRRLNKLKKSVIILDEVQAIPVKYWKIIETVLQEAAEDLDFYIILSTATKPLLFSQTNELVHSRPKLSRYVIYNRARKKIPITEFIKEPILSSDSFLVILNTINSAKYVYSQIKDQDTVYLSTHIIPKERLARIKDIMAGKYKKVVSTQLVEAGVDINFPIVIRDFAPLDSIVQAAGRCNRHSVSQDGKVFLYYLHDHRNRTFASYIYDNILLSITYNLLTSQEITEEDITQLIDEYYLQVLKSKAFFESDDLFNAIKYARFDGERSLADFKLLEDRPEVDVFIEIDEEAAKLWKEYTSLREKRNFDVNKFLTIRRKLYDYVITVPRWDISEPVDGLFYIPKNMLYNYYDIETGWLK